MDKYKIIYWYLFFFFSTFVTLSSMLNDLFSVLFDHRFLYMYVYIYLLFCLFLPLFLVLNIKSKCRMILERLMLNLFNKKYGFLRITWLIQILFAFFLFYNSFFENNSTKIIRGLWKLVLFCKSQFSGKVQNGGGLKCRAMDKRIMFFKKCMKGGFSMLL